MTPADNASAKLITPPKAPSRRFAYLLLLTLALVLFVVRAQVAVNDPFFGGDAAFRMNHAERPIVRMANRLWLPYLQTHIWVSYHLGLPAYAFHLIPCFYFLLAVSALGVLSFRVCGRTYSALLFSLFLMFCFANQRLVAPLSATLYQEIIGCAFFYLLLCGGALDLKKNPLLLPLAGAALMTRDSIWIYLFAVTVLNARSILSDRKYLASFLLLWALVGVWLTSLPLKLLIAEGRLPAIPAEWPLMINKAGNRALSDPVISAQSLWAALSRSRAIFLLMGLAAAWVAGRFGRGGEANVAEPQENFGAKFKPFSLLSIALVYGLILLFNPWEATFGGTRMAFPAVEHSFVWAIVLFRKSLQYSTGRRMLAGALLAAGLLMGLDPRMPHRRLEENFTAQACHTEIQKLIQQTGGGHVDVCLAGESFWELAGRFVAPTLYARRHFQEAAGNIPEKCELLILPADKSAPGNQWLLEKGDCAVGGQTYRIFRRRRSR